MKTDKLTVDQKRRAKRFAQSTYSSITIYIQLPIIHERAWSNL